MKENFWAELPKPFFILAPMEDVTDVVFRHVVQAAGAPDVFFTEFTNSDSFCHP
ncbi:tRNA-dihydrouridine synthase, partial [Escherichia coli]|nr:tRNA-dihydrouridine synthase [Escherichia coli]